MKKRRIKVKANAMEDADVNFISLVTRPASRIPFRVMKSDDPLEGSSMFNLTRLFKQDGESAIPADCVLAGVVVQQKHEAEFAPKLKELGLKIDDRVEKDGAVILKQCDFDEDKVTLIKLNEMGGLFLNASEKVQKQFDPFPEGTDFSENFNQGAFLPGVHIATDVMMETMRNVLRTAEDQTAARAGIGTLLNAYTNHVLDFVDELPEVAFKIDEMELETPAPGEGDSQDAAGDADAGDADAGDDEAGKDDADAGAGDGADDAGDSAAADDADAAGEADAGDAGDADAGESVQKDDGLTDEERKKLKSVHIEDLDTDGDAEVNIDADGKIKSKDDKDESASGDADDSKSAEKSDESEPDLAAIIKAALAPVLEAVSGVRTDVADLKSKQDKLAEKVDSTAEMAEKATKAVKGTVPSNSDGGDNADQSLGTHRSKGEASDEKFWGGTSLDRIAGDVEAA